MQCRTIYLHGFSGDDQGLKEFAEAMPYRPYDLWLMPGFGGRTVSPQARDDFIRYASSVINDIVQRYPNDRFRLVGHSQGAIVAYGVASLYPDKLDELILINPVAWPRRVTRVASRVLAVSSKVAPGAVVGFMRQPGVVKAFSRYMSRGHSGDAQQRIYITRQREAAHYSADMLRLSGHSLSFKKVMSQSNVAVPTVLCYASDDHIAGRSDALWYQQHCTALREVYVTNGGHLSVIAQPDMVAGQFKGRGDD